MEVFSETYLAEQARRWEARKERDWPLITRIALDSRRADDRERIESCLSALHEDDQEKIVGHLRNETSFVTAFGELLVGKMLIDAGLDARYEPRVTTEAGHLTPDWYVNEPKLICDVFTAGLRKERDDDETALRELEARLAEGNVGAMIAVEMPRPSETDAGARKRIVSDVISWLRAGPDVGTTKSFGQLVVEVLTLGGDGLDVMLVEPMHLVDTPASIAVNFDSKVKKYGQFGWPLVVAAVKHHRAEIDEFDVGDALLGRLAYVSRHTTSGTSVGRTERLAGGVFQQRPALSAALFVEPHCQPKPKVHLWDNPFAEREIGNDLRQRLRSAHP